MQGWIEQTLQDRFQPSFLEVIDESAHHQHHAEGGRSSGTHFKITLFSPLFQNKTRLEIHRMIYAALEEGFLGVRGLPKLHALALTASADPRVLLMAAAESTPVSASNEYTKHRGV